MYKCFHIGHSELESDSSLPVSFLLVLGGLSKDSLHPHIAGGGGGGHWPPGKLFPPMVSPNSFSITLKLCDFIRSRVLAVALKLYT